MSWYPPAIRKPIAPGVNDPPIVVVGAILHVAVSTAASLYDYFNGPSGGVESHFYIDLTGRCEQYRSTSVEADANYAANSFLAAGERHGFVSIETAGLERGVWNPAQMAAIKALLTWLAAEHHFPLRVCTGPQAPGVGYHTLFPTWTPPGVRKTCPGPDRIAQFKTDLTPWFATATQDEAPVTPAEIAAIADAVLKTPAIRNQTVPDPEHPGAYFTLAQSLSWVEQRTERIETELVEVASTLAAVLAEVTRAGP